METRVSSNSVAADLLAYGRERVTRWRIASLALLVTGTAFLVDPPLDGGDALLRAGLALLLIAQFRVWDDLADRAYDSAHHPARVLARSATTARFWALFATLSAGAVFAVGKAGSIAAISILAGLMALLAAVYHGPWHFPRDRFVRSQAVLLKYPAFIVLLTASGPSRRAILGGAIVYLLLSVYEWRDDPATRATRAGGRILVLLAVAVVVAVVLAAWPR